jgi:hypothetical protein
VFGLGVGIVLSVLIIIGNRRYHSGYHIWDIRPATASPHRLNIWMSQWCYLFSTGAVKISVLLFYRRLSVSFTRGFLWATWVGIVFNLAQITAFSIALLTLCRPISAYWTSFDRVWAMEHQGEYQCSYEGLSLTMSAVVSVVGDFYAALLPSLLIIKLKMPLRQKIALMGLFAVGYIVVAAGVGRAILLNRVVTKDYDYTWTLWEAWIWSLLELWLGLLAASAPALKPFFIRFLIDPIRSATGSSPQNSYQRKSGGTIGSTPSKRRPVHSWNRLSNLNSPTPDLTDDSLGKSVTWTTAAVELEPPLPSKQDLERGQQASTSPIAAKNSPEVHRDTDYTARCWSPASAPILVANTDAADTKTSHHPIARIPNSVTIARSLSSLSHRRGLSSDRHVASQHREHRPINATPRSRRNLSTATAASNISSSTEPQVPVDVTKDSSAVIPTSPLTSHPVLFEQAPKARSNFPADSEDHWLIDPQRERFGAYKGIERSVAWSVVDEDPEEEPKGGLGTRTGGARDRRGSGDSACDSEVLPRDDVLGIGKAR